MKDYKNIQELLDRYWEGESTLEEERLLKAYFASGSVDEKHRQFAPLFQAIREEQQVELKNKAKPVSIRPVSYNWQGWAMAASVALLIGAGWWMLRQDNHVDTMAGQLKEEQPVLDQSMQPASPSAALAETPAQPLEKVVARKKITHKVVKPSPEIDAETAQAMAEIKAALALVSSKIGKGRNEATKGTVHLETLDRVIKKKEG